MRRILTLAAGLLALAAATLATAAAAQADVSYSISNRGTQNVLNVGGALQSDGAAVIDWPYVPGAMNARWRAEPVADGTNYARLKAVHRGKCLNIDGGKALFGARLVQSTCNGTFSQQWRLEYVGGFQTSAYYRLISRAAVGTGLVPVVSQWTPGPGQELVMAFQGNQDSVFQHFILTVYS